MNPFELAARTAKLSDAKRRMLEQRLHGAPTPTAGAISKRAAGGPAPLSFAQRRLWFLDQLAPGTAVHNIPTALRIAGVLDAVSLERGFATLAARQHSLCTTVATADGEPVQLVDVRARVPWRAVDVSHLGDADRERAAWELSVQEARRPFELARGPLWRALLIRLGPEDHLLILTLHHIVADGSSMAILTREMSELYAAEVELRPHRLHALPIQYADFAQWQREWLVGDVLERHTSYWRRQLANAPMVLELPTDRARPSVQRHDGGCHTHEVPSLVADALRLFGHHEGSSLFMVLLAAFAVLVHRHAGQQDLLIGTPVANRTRLETEELIGCFVNTLVLRLRVEGNPTVRRLLGHVRDVMLDALAHQAMPFEAIVDGLQPWRDPARQPVAQVMFVLQNALQLKPELPGLAIRQVPIATGLAKFDLTLEVVEKPDGRLLTRWEYAADLFEAETIARMAERFSVLLDGMVRDPDRRVDALPLLAPSERTQVLTKWNRTDDHAGSGLVHLRIEAQAERVPDAVAVVCGDASLSYGALDRDASRLAQRLRRLGVGPEVRAGLYLRRRLDVVVAILGVLKAGGAYVPLDPNDPLARITYMLADAGVRVIVTDDSLRDRLSVPDGLAVVSVDAATLEDDAAGAPAHRVAHGNLAYVLYTSGTTGPPKGVAVQHAALDSYLTWAARTYPARSAALHTSLSFDLSVTSLFVPLLSGGCVELIDETDPLGALTRRLELADRLDLLKLTPTHLHALATLLERRHIGAAPTCLVVGGEALRGDRLDRWRERCPDTTIVNEYGPTETVVGCCLDVRALKDVPAGPVPIGRPAPNVRVYVLDPTGEPTPIGVPGELYVGGAQVARGYLNRPALTAERFVPDPFSATPGARLYRTGDRARWRTDGTLEYLGRDDDQVKIRGFRIEPGECERVLRRQPGVDDCVIAARESPTGEPCLVAYVVGPARATDLLDALREQLPAYMVPATVVAVDTIPRNANGKIDRRALPPPTFETRDIEYVAPRGDVERRLVEIWTDVLNVRRVGVLDNFFDLGGNSLSLARAHDKLRERWSLPLVELFRHPTIRSLAAHLSDPMPAAARPADDRHEPIARVAARLSLRAARAQSADLRQ